MKEQTGPIFYITGVPGSGKSSVATALMRRFPFGMHLPIDDMREFVVSGIVPPFPWTEEVSRQFALAREASAQTARLYADAGFAVALDDVIFPHEVHELCTRLLAGKTIHKIFLQPTLDTVLTRNASRTNKDFDTTVLIEVIHSLHPSIAAQPFAEAGWIVIDSTELSLEQTVETILQRIGLEQGY